MNRNFAFSVLGSVVLIFALSCTREGVKQQPSPRELYDRATEFYGKEKYFKAQMEFQRLIYGWPGQPFIDTVQFYLGMSFYGMEMYPEATGEFKRLLQAYPSSAFADDAQYYVAMCHYRQSPKYHHDPTETYNAIDEFSLLITEYPDSPLIPEARARLDTLNAKLAKKMYKSGELYMKLNDYEPALLYFGLLRDSYPDTEWAVLAFYYSGEAQMRLGRSSDALETFESFVVAFPDHKLASKARKKISQLKSNRAGG